jgi:hypothetical protein
LSSEQARQLVSEQIAQLPDETPYPAVQFTQVDELKEQSTQFVSIQETQLPEETP